MFFSQTPCYVSRKAQCPFRNFPLENHSFLPCRIFGRNGWSWLKNLFLLLFFLSKKTKQSLFDAHLFQKEKCAFSYIAHFQFPNILLFFFLVVFFFCLFSGSKLKRSHSFPLHSFLIGWFGFAFNKEITHKNCVTAYKALISFPFIPNRASFPHQFC